jgi:hypothetical protein
MASEVYVADVEGVMPAAESHCIFVSLSASLLKVPSRTHLVRRQCLEQVDGLLEIVDNLLGRCVVTVALWLQCRNASSVLGPLVLPERLVIALVVFPVCLHIGEEIRLAERLDDGGDVRVSAGRVTVRIVCAVASVRPTSLTSDLSPDI